MWLVIIPYMSLGPWIVVSEKCIIDKHPRRSGYFMQCSGFFIRKSIIMFHNSSPQQPVFGEWSGSFICAFFSFFPSLSGKNMYSMRPPYSTPLTNSLKPDSYRDLHDSCRTGAGATSCPLANVITTPLSHLIFPNLPQCRPLWYSLKQTSILYCLALSW